MGGVQFALFLGARCLMSTFTWCQVSEIPQNLVPGVPYALLLGAMYPLCTFTWCQVSYIPQNLVPGVPLKCQGASCSGNTGEIGSKPANYTVQLKSVKYISFALDFASCGYTYFRLVILLLL